MFLVNVLIHLISDKLVDSVVLVHVVVRVELAVLVVGQDNQSAVDELDASGLAVADVAPQNQDGQLVEDLLLDQAGQRTSTVGGRVAGVTEVVLGLVRHVDCDLAVVVLQPLLDFHETDVDNLADLAAAAEGVHDKLAGRRVDLALAARGLGEVLGAQVGGHDDDAVLGVDDTALTVGDAAVVHELEEDGQHLLGSLFHLVEEEDGERLAAEGLGELATGIVADVSRGSTNHPAKSMSLLVLGHVEADHGLGVVEEELGESLGQESLTGTGGTAEQEAGWLVGVAETRPLEADGVGDGLDGFLLTDDDLTEDLLHVDELILFARLEASDGDASPAGHDLVDVVGGDNIGDHGVVVLAGSVESGVGSGLLGLELLDDGALLGDGAILKVGSLGVVSGVGGFLQTLLELVELRLGHMDLLTSLDLAEVLLAERFQLLLDVLGVLSRLDQAGLGGLILLLLQSGNFNHDLAELALERVDDFGLRLSCDSNSGGGLVDQVDGRVGKSPGSEVASSKVGGCYQGVIKNGDAVVSVVSLLETTEDGNGLADAGFLDKDLLEPTFESSILFDILAVLGKGRGTDAVQLTTSKHGLQQQVDLVDEEDNHLLGILNLLQNTLHPLLKLSAVLASGHQGADVERQQLAGLQVVGHIAVDDALGETFDDGSLTDSGLTDEDGVVLRPARQDPYDSPDLLLAANDGVHILVSGQGRHVDGELGKVLMLLLGIGIFAVHPLRAANLGDGIVHQLRLGDVGLLQTGLYCVVLGQGLDEVVDGNEAVLLRLLQLLRLAQDGVEGGCHGHLVWRRVLARQTDECLLERSVESLGIAVCALDDLPEHRGRLLRAVLLILGQVCRGVEKGDCEVDGQQLGVSVLLGEGHRILHGLLASVGEFHS
ncbi:ATP-dependent Clp protease ATP-binding protein subunit ClpB [Colletotrichum tofieldiae]|nr:ATP-dependent Clp protease ATP-binding protein subunit ClpB [Colletotrichum tofieldiae]GKT73597.1 ATP-dependent Clp protease ATP-binding protein subunit ClpB [Colletotrichum tofieldiae]